MLNVEQGGMSREYILKIKVNPNTTFYSYYFFLGHREVISRCFLFGEVKCRKMRRSLMTELGQNSLSATARVMTLTYAPGMSIRHLAQLVRVAPVVTTSSTSKMCLPRSSSALFMA